MKLFLLLLLIFVVQNTIFSKDPFRNNRFINVSGWELLKNREFEFGFEYRPYTLNNSEKPDIKTYRLSLGFDYGYNKNFDVSIYRSIDSDDNVDNNDIKPLYELRYKLNSKWTSDIVMGFLYDSDADNFNTFYIMYKYIGIGMNFSGNEQRNGIAHYGGYNIVNQEVQKYFVLLGGEWDFNKNYEFPVRLVADYNGDEVNMGLRLVINKNNNILFNWQRKGDYSHLAEYTTNKESENWFLTYTLHL